MSSIEIGMRTDKTEANPYGYVKVASIPEDEVCVLYLGGDGADTDRTANGYAKIIENEILADIDAKISVYSIKYNFDGHKKTVARQISNIKHRAEVLISQAKIDEIVQKATIDEYNPQYVDSLFEKAILPRISSLNGKEKLSVEEACKRIRKLNIVTYCHGAYVALKLEEKMQAKMNELGYSNEERKQIQSQMLVVAHAPACVLGLSKSQFVSFKSVYDSSTPLKGNFFDVYIENRKCEERKRFAAEENKDETKIKENRWFDFEPCFFNKKQGNLFMIKQKYKWVDEEGPFMINSDEHNNVQYKDATQTKEGRLLGWFSKNILQNGIKNSLQQDSEHIALPPLEELILDDNPQTREKALAVFDKMKANGLKFRNEIFMEAREYHKNMVQR